MSYIKIKNLKKYYNSNNNLIKALDGITFNIEKSEILSIVGESGSGKTTLGKIISGIYYKDFGEIIIDNKKIEEYDRKTFSKKIQMIYQDTKFSLNPKMKIIDIIAEGLDIHKLYTNKEDRKNKVIKLLELVKLGKEYLNKYPSELSGGQRQRVVIARALSLEPEILICDEPTSSLDISIQAQIINLLKDLNKEKQLTIIFITHNLSIANYLSDKMIVINKGKIVEYGKTKEILKNPKNIYTISLIKAATILI